MKYPTRIYYTETDKAEMWDRWQKGESLNSIARHFGRGHSSIQGILARTGGIRPPQRKRPIGSWVQANFSHPRLYESCILPSRQMKQSVYPAWDKVPRRTQFGSFNPALD